MSAVQQTLPVDWVDPAPLTGKAVGVGDWWSPICPPCIAALVDLAGLDQLDEAIIRFAVENVVCPAGWYGPEPFRAETTKKEMAERLRIHPATLGKRLDRLAHRNLIEFEWQPNGRPGWVRSPQYSSLVETDQKSRAHRAKVSAKHRRVAERIDRREVERTHADGASERIGHERVETVRDEFEIEFEIRADEWEPDPPEPPPDELWEGEW